MAKNVTATEVKVEAPVSAVDKFKSQLPELLEKHKTMSAVFRFLKAEGLTTGEIAKVTEKRYQHVRNVLITPLTGKKEAAESESKTA
jgi:uncharacterized protein YbbC (DUF1343 family)